jgi:pimeloyl-ACP methyl ester carboxylesterase
VTQHLVLIPGLLCDDTAWTEQIRALRTQVNIQVADHGTLSSLTMMAQRILDKAPERFAMVGHSMGGRVALEVMRLAPQRVERLGLFDTAYKALAPGEGGAKEKAGRLALLEIARRHGMHAMARRWVQNMVHPARLEDERLIESIVTMFTRKTPEIYAAQIQALLKRPDATGLLTAIRCPTLVLCGADDAWSTLSVHQQMAALIPQSTLVSVAICGHMSTMERPREVIRAMSDWLQL